MLLILCLKAFRLVEDFNVLFKLFQSQESTLKSLFVHHLLFDEEHLIFVMMNAYKVH